MPRLLIMCDVDVDPALEDPEVVADDIVREHYDKYGDSREQAKIVVRSASWLDDTKVEKHYPRRDDEVAKWIKAQRDQYPVAASVWDDLDDLLDLYRLHADTGTALNDPMGKEADHG